MNKVIKIESEAIEFDNGYTLQSGHESDCCEHHWLDFNNLTLADFDKLEFDLSTDDFFRRIPDYGIELIPVHGWSVKVPGYGRNNGWYSSNLSLTLYDDKGIPVKEYDITECQDIDDN